MLDIRNAANDQEEEALVRREIPTWATLMHDIINHGREMGWNDLPNETKSSGCNVRQIQQTSQNNLHDSEPIGQQSKTHRWKELYNQVLALGIPRIAVQRQSITAIQSLIQTFQKCNKHNQGRNAPNSQKPSLAPRKSENPFLPQNSKSKNE